MIARDDRWRVVTGDCRDVMASMEADSIDSIVTDPPYGLSFMGKGWDHAVPGVEFWEAALRVAKPGAHLLAFGGTRLFHRLAVAIEDAGWEVRDCVMWVYGSGFPKSLDVSKAIDKAAGAERNVVGSYSGATNIGKKSEGKWGYGADGSSNPGCDRTVNITAPATDAAKQWFGWGTALKPSWEPVIVARKPLIGTVAANVLAHGTGALNIDGCRVGTETVGWAGAGGGCGTWNSDTCGLRKPGDARPVQGRWPANLIHDGSDEVVGLFPDANGSKPGSFQREKTSRGLQGGGYGQERASMREKTQLEKPGYADAGRAARFFYCAKASKRDRDERNAHPTVKPTALMRYLCRLVTPPNGVVLDPFCGSGSTGKAAVLEGFRFVGAEMDEHYADIARGRIAAAADQAAGRLYA